MDYNCIKLHLQHHLQHKSPHFRISSLIILLIILPTLAADDVQRIDPLGKQHSQPYIDEIWCCVSILIHLLIFAQPHSMSTTDTERTSKMKWNFAISHWTIKSHFDCIWNDRKRANAKWSKNVDENSAITFLKMTLCCAANAEFFQAISSHFSNSLHQHNFRYFC